MMKKIGILGGMGSVSTVYFYNQLVKKLQKEKGAVYHSDFPYMLIINLPIPDNVDKLKNKIVMESMLVDAVKVLDDKVDFIVMPCNTEHLFYNNMTKNISTRFINLIEEIVNVLVKEKANNVLLLATESSIKNKLVESHIKNKKIKLKYPFYRHQQIVNKVIWDLLQGKENYGMVEDLKMVMDSYDFDCVLFGCTELSILKKYFLDKYKIFDSIDILLEKTYWLLNQP